MKMTEYQMQCAIKDFADAHKLPMMHSPNEGKRSVVTGHRLKRAGLMPGASDCFFLKGNTMYKGLWIELKIKPNIPSKEQLRFLELVNSLGYLGDVCYDLDEALALISAFYGL